MTVCYFDTETRSPVPITLGTDAYMEKAECILVQWALDNDPVSVWEPLDEPPPPELVDIFDDEDIQLIAQNSPFDRRVVRKCLKRRTPIKRWRCTRAQAYSSGLPGSLESIGHALSLTEDEAKLSTGKDLIRVFCIPRPDGGYNDRTTHPLEWQDFIAYGRQDVAALRHIHKRMPSHNYRGVNLRSWWLDQLISERGFKFDTVLAAKCVDLLEIAKKRSDEAIQAETWDEELQCSAVEAMTQRQKLLDYLVSRGVDMPNMKAATVREYLERDDLPPEMKFVLQMRLEAAKSSGSKFKKGLAIRGLGDRLRFCIQWSGAGRTGRASHKNFQPGNMTRPSKLYGKRIPELIEAITAGVADLAYDELNTVCADVLRSTITASEGCDLVDADWSNIEGRILAWIAEETWKLDAYRAQDEHTKLHGTDCKCGMAPDGYKALFSKFFGIPIDDVDDFMRQIGKVVDLSMGYLGGVGAFATMAVTYGLKLATIPALVLPQAKPEHLKKADRAWRRAFLNGEDFGLEPDVYRACDVLKQVYREANSNIKKLGYAIDKAVRGAIEDRSQVFHVAKCQVWCTDTFLIIQLPSGRRLLYANPKIIEGKLVDPETGEERITYTVTYVTARGKGWHRERAWMGLFLENIVQAIAHDVLRFGLLRVHNHCQQVPVIRDYLAGVDAETAIVLHIHDQILCDVPKNSLAVEKLIELMCTHEDWMRGLPLAAAGYVGQRLRKG